MPLLRWPHDRHRGLCTRPGAQPQAINRHLMNSRLMPDQTDAHPHRWPSAGIAAARAADTKWRLSHLLDPSVCATNRRRLMPSGHKYPVRQLPVSPASHNHRAAPLAPGLNPHSARRTTCNLLPRLRALALLRRRPHTRPARPPIRRPRNLHKAQSRCAPARCAGSGADRADSRAREHQ